MASIQLLGYRNILDPNTGKGYRKQIYFNKDTPIYDAVEFFNSTIKEVVDLIPRAERYDCHYTVALCSEPSSSVPLRTFERQNIIPFDFDGIDLDMRETYLEILFKRLQIDRKKCIIINSGHGLHVLVAVTQFIDSVEELNKIRKYYVELCNELSLEFFNNGLSGNLDPQRLSEAATMRLPFTINNKDPENPVDCYIMSGMGSFEPQPLYLDKLITLPDKEETKFKTARGVDTKAVLAGCDFLNLCKDNQKSVTEPQWYALLSTLSFVPEIGRNLCHEYSKEHSSYSFEDTESKIDQAMGFGKPRTCEAINQVYPSCTNCPHYGKVKTPIAIKGEDYIKTKDTGFHDIIPADPPKVIPNYDDLRKFFIQKHNFIVDANSQEVWVYNGSRFEVDSSKVLNL